MTHYSFNQPVTTDQYTHLRQPHWQADMNISLCDNVLAFSAQLNATLPSVSGTTAAVLTYTSAISGSYTNIDEGMVCIVSPTNDPRYPTAVRLRVRLDGVAGVVADSTHVYVNEYSDILGLGSYIFVYYAYDLIDSLSRPTGTSPSIVQLQDYNQPYTTMAPVIRGTDTLPIQTGYAGYVDSDDADLHVAFDASGSFSPQSGATISSYLYTVTPTGGGTYGVLEGDPTTATVTYGFHAGEFWVKLVVTDSLGVTNFRHILIKSHSDAYPPQDGFEGVEIQRDIVQGPSARVKFYDNVSSLLNGTMAIFWVKEMYSDEDFGNPSVVFGENGSLFGNTALIGWIETEEDQFVTDPVYSLYTEVQFEVQGVGARLARIEGQLLAITNAASPTQWDQIKNLTPWRAVVHFLQHHTQALHLCDFTADDLTDGYKFPTITTIAGNALDNISGQQGITWQVRSALAFARDGRILMETRADFDTSYVSDLTHVATWTDQDVCGQVNLRMNQYIQYGFINGDGACWDGTSAAPVPFLSRAPGLAQSSGTDQGQFNNQILTSGQVAAAAQAQLNQFAGTMYAIDNNTTEMTVTHPDGYWWIETSYSQLYVFNLDFAVRGITLDGNTYWMVKSVTQQFDNKTGSGTVQVVYIPVVSGFPGTTVPIINNTALTPPPILPPIPAFGFELPETTIPDPGLTTSPTTPPTTDRQGQIVLEVSANGAALSITQSYILLHAPTWRAYTPPLPSGYSLTDACFDQLSSTGGFVSVYALASDGTNSIIFHNANVLDASQSWLSTGTPFSGKYTQIRSSGTPGSVLVYAPVDGTIVNGSYNFLTSNGGWIEIPWPTSIGSVASATYVGGTGWTADSSNCQNFGFTHIIGAYLLKGFASSTNLIHAKMHVDNGVSFTDGANGTEIHILDSSFATLAIPYSGVGPISSSYDIEWFGSVAIPAGGYVGFITKGGHKASDCTIPGTEVVTSALLETSTAPGNANVRLSNDYGATVGSALDLGSFSGGAGGFDLIRSGGVSYASALDAILKASSLGGAYSAFATLTANAISLCIPYYEVGSDVTTQTTSSSPQVVIGLDAEVSGTCLYWLDGSATPTAITTPASGATITIPDRITMLRGKKIAVIVTVDGISKLYVAENLAAAGTATWTFVENVGANATLRTRRNDPRLGTNKGQLFVFDTPSGYSSKWASAGEFDRISPTGAILAGDILG